MNLNKGGMMNSKKYFLCMGVICLLFFAPGYAIPDQDQDEQPKCEVLKKFTDKEGDIGYIVKVEGKTFFAVSEKRQKNIMKMKVDLITAQQELNVKNEQLADYNSLKAQYDITVKHQKEYIRELESMLTGYKSLLRDYKKLKTPSLTAEIGIGITGSDSDPAVLMGLGLRKFRLYGFFQEKNAGVMVGLALPIF
jgi:hypothetical protein